MSLHKNSTLSPWVIDNRATHEGQHGLGSKPLALGAVVAEIPTAFGTHTVRDSSTIGKPCPSKDELDALGLQRAHMVKALPLLIPAAREALATFKRQLLSERSCGLPFCGDDEHEAIRLLTAALACAEGREEGEATA